MTKCLCGCGQEVSHDATWRQGHHKRGEGGYILAERVRGVQPHELGTTGTSIYSGMFQSDINSDFNNRDVRLDRYEKMEKTDSACRALFLVITLPIRSVKWWVEPASESAEDKKIAESVQWNLTDGMTASFDDFLSEALTCVSRGFSVFEKVYELADADEFSGKIKWRKFAFRSQRTIEKWKLDKTGGLEGVRQVFREGDFKVDTEIPVEKLLVFSYQREGSNYEGDALFRACWRDYFYKDSLQRIEAIGLERFWVGLPYITLPAKATSADKDKAFEIVTEIRGDEAAGMVLPEGWEFNIERVATEGGAMNDVILRYARNIFLTGLAHFMSLGQGDSGSWALSRDQSALFLFALNAIADTTFGEIMNKHAIPQLVRMNWPNVKKFPKLRHDDLDQIDMTGFVANLKGLVEAGFLTSPDDVIERQIREMFGLPELTDEMIKERDDAAEEMAKQMQKQEEAKLKVPGKEPPEEKPPAKLEEYNLPPVLITEDDIVQAILDFAHKAPGQVAILDAAVV